ncbi:MAG: hypothetical protein LBC62_04250 [Treponema sp.]|jgi:hypothetical protein|nr:hypothetical protein [Treponema sp.]
MREIWISEFFIGLFLFLALIRTRVKKLAALAGIVWLPLAAFLLSIGLFPAYGFRPEVLPLAAFAGLAALLHIPAMISTRGRARADTYPEKKPPFSLIAGLLLLALVLYPAFRFSPLEPAAPDSEVLSFTLRDDDTRRVFKVRLYTAGERGNSRPLLVIGPPVFGATALEDVCAELAGKGFTVLSYTRQGPASPAEWFRRFRAFSAGTRSAAANERGRALEEASRRDLLAVLDGIAGNPELREGLSLFDTASKDDLFLAGYDTGASALVLLAGNPSFTRTWQAVKGIIAVESPLWSLYRQEERVFEAPPPDAGWFASMRAGLGSWAASLKPKKITGLREIPGAVLPVLYLVSDRALEAKYRLKYEAVFGSLKAGKKPAVLAAAAGAGPLDYAGFPSKYPLLSRLYNGRQEDVWKDREAAGGTARIIANFAAVILEAEETGDVPLSVEPLPKGIRLESGNWNLKPIGLY